MSKKLELDEKTLADVLEDVIPQFAVTKQQAKTVLNEYFNRKELQISVDEKLFDRVWNSVVGNTAPKRYETKALVIQYLEELRKKKRR